MTDRKRKLLDMINPHIDRDVELYKMRFNNDKTIIDDKKDLPNGKDMNK